MSDPLDDPGFRQARDDFKAALQQLVDVFWAGLTFPVAPAYEDETPACFPLDCEP